jgi:lipoprotein-anchoring transpeptidase ErfK/SrfK
MRRATLLMLALAALLLPATALAQEPLPEPAPPAPVAVAGTTVAGVDISGMDEPTALAAVKLAFRTPITLTVSGKAIEIRQSTLKPTYGIDEAVAAAMLRTGPGNTPVVAEADPKALERVVADVLRRTTKPAVDPEWRIGRTPRLTRARAGAAPIPRVVEAQIVNALAQPLLRPGQREINLKVIEPDFSVARLGHVVTVSKGERHLRLWAPVRGKGRAIKRYRIAVGAPSFPTPSGRFWITNMQVNPWWYPPDSDWAEGQEPVPPGPSNPLGTRWMGLNRDNIGIHGTPNSGSLGTYASHGCIRMWIPAAEELYSIVRVGTPVVIY